MTTRFMHYSKQASSYSLSHQLVKCGTTCVPLGSDDALCLLCSMAALACTYAGRYLQASPVVGAAPCIPTKGIMESWAVEVKC